MSLSQAFESVENAREFYAQWTQEIMRQYKPIQLDVRKDGNWQVLCQALNISDVPQEPFPKANQGQDFRSNMNSIRAGIWKKVAWRTLFALVTATMLASIMGIAIK